MKIILAHPCAVWCASFVNIQLFPPPPPTPQLQTASLSLFSCFTLWSTLQFAGPHKHTFWGLVLINCVMLLSNSLCLMTADADFWASEWKTCLGGSGRHRGPGRRPGLHTPAPPVAWRSLHFYWMCPTFADLIVRLPSFKGQTELASSLKRLFSILQRAAIHPT